MILKIIFALFLPPLAVLLHRGVGKDLLINIVLTILFFLPGSIHAIWLLTNRS